MFLSDCKLAHFQHKTKSSAMALTLNCSPGYIHLRGEPCRSGQRTAWEYRHCCMGRLYLPVWSITLQTSGGPCLETSWVLSTSVFLWSCEPRAITTLQSTLAILLQRILWSLSWFSLLIWQGPHVLLPFGAWQQLVMSSWTFSVASK